MLSYKDILLKNKPKPKPKIFFQTKNYFSKYVEPILESNATVPEVLQTHFDCRAGRNACY
jgi:hypothetical protein